MFSATITKLHFKLKPRFESYIEMYYNLLALQCIVDWLLKVDQMFHFETKFLLSVVKPQVNHPKLKVLAKPKTHFAENTSSPVQSASLDNHDWKRLPKEPKNYF